MQAFLSVFTFVSVAYQTAYLAFHGVERTVSIFGSRHAFIPTSDLIVYETDMITLLNGIELRDDGF